MFVVAQYKRLVLTNFALKNFAQFSLLILARSRFLIHHSNSVIVFVICFLKKVEIYQHTSSQQNSFHSHIQINRKINSENIRVCKSFFQKSRPLFANFAHFRLAIWRHNFELHVTSTNGSGTNWAFNG